MSTLDRRSELTPEEAAELIAPGHAGGWETYCWHCPWGHASDSFAAVLSASSDHQGATKHQTTLRPTTDDPRPRIRLYD